jgi:transcriptional regulator with XRE-family HTH domain
MPSAAERRKAKEKRNREFRAALALAGMSGQQFADKHGVSFGHLWQVARGDRDSDVLEPEIEAFIQKEIDALIEKHLISKNALVA